MQYHEAIAFLYGLRLFGMKLGLENTFKLAHLAGDPQEHLRFIHVAGTNGKGSTCAMLEGIYRAAGLRVGLFTSPHLVSFTERIQVNRQPISQTEVVRLVAAMRDLIGELKTTPSSGAPAPPSLLEALHPTFFEVITIMALKYFEEQKCDLVIWETGLGGRLDATNIVTPLASVITNIQLDHQQWLGNTLADIAREKAGIIKPGIPVITGATEPAATGVISRIAHEKKAPLTCVTKAAAADALCETSLLGAHQKLNAATALATVQALAGKLPVITSAICAGLKDVNWLGRLQIVQPANGPTVVLDAAHNPAGAETLAGALRQYFPTPPPTLILGIMRDKDWAGIVRVLAPLAAKILLTHVASDRSADPEQLIAACREANPQAATSTCATLTEAWQQAVGEPFVVITGSIHFIGEAMEVLGLASGANERALNEYQAFPKKNAGLSP